MPARDCWTGSHPDPEDPKKDPKMIKIDFEMTEC